MNFEENRLPQKLACFGGTERTIWQKCVLDTTGQIEKDIEEKTTADGQPLLSTT